MGGTEAEPMRAGTVDAAGDHVRYIVVVHGMGRQRPVSTLLDAIRGFSRTRSAQPGEGPDLPLTLGAAQSPALWVELEGIPRVGRRQGEALALPAESGENLRFAEVHWAQLLEQEVRTCAEPADRWVHALTSRLGLRERIVARGAGGAPVVWGLPFWLMHQLRLLRTLVRFTRPLLRLARRDLEELIYGEFLGDVQAYCESGPARARSVEQFRARLSALHSLHGAAETLRLLRQGVPPEEARPDHPRARPARFQVFAHSLGSVLAVEALLRAHRLAPGEPLPAWCACVDSLTTFGSPIDKVLLLWPDNYRDVADPAFARAVQEGVAARGDAGAVRTRIRHLNVAEESDVVADPLVALRALPAYRALFDAPPAPVVGEPMPDRVLRTTPNPAAAHTAYWRPSSPLFDLASHNADPEGSWLPAAAGPGAAREVRHSKLVASTLPFAAGALVATFAAALPLVASALWALGLAAAVVLLALLSSVSVSLFTWCRELARARCRTVDSLCQAEDARWDERWGLWAVSLVLSALLASLLRQATGLSELAPLVGVALCGALALCWRAARASGEARRWRGLLAALAVVPAVGVIALALLLATGGSGGGPALLTIDPLAIAMASLAGGVGVWFAGRSESLPAEARTLRRSAPKPILGSWGLAAAVWLASYLAFDLGRGCLREACAPALAPGALVRTEPLPALLEFVFLWQCVTAALLTQARYQRLLAGALLGWSAWQQAWTHPDSRERVVLGYLRPPLAPPAAPPAPPAPAPPSEPSPAAPLA